MDSRCSHNKINVIKKIEPNDRGRENKNAETGLTFAGGSFPYIKGGRVHEII